MGMIDRRPIPLLLILIPLILIASPAKPMAAAAAAIPPAKTAYEVLLQYGLPSGIFPKGVREFIIGDDGRFEVHLDEECTARFETEVRYARNITCKLAYGQIDSISGLAAQELFLWFPVRGIRVDIPSSGLIYFDVGVIYKQFSLSLFETPPDCSPSTDHLLESKSGRLRYVLDRKDSVIAVV